MKVLPRRTGTSVFCRKKLKALAATVLCASIVVTGCSSGEEDVKDEPTRFFGYAVDEYLVTSNAGSAEGAATSAQMLASRLYPSAHIMGPKGQLIPNSDFVTTQVVPGSNTRVIFKISPEARYSDGAPVTCDSMLLAYTAGKMRNIFHSYLPLAEQVERVDCQPGTLQATVVFKQGYGTRWRQLFGPGVLMPAHAVAKKAGMTLEELNSALEMQDEYALAEVARVWNEGFRLDKFDPELQVSSGPYKIDSVGEHGEVHLVRNPEFNGAPAEEERIAVWPKNSDLKALKDAGDLYVVEASSDEGNDFFDRNDPTNVFDVFSEPGALTDSLVLASSGLFYSPENRAAFAKCVDQNKVAEASAQASGVEVEPVLVRSVRHNDATAPRLADISKNKAGTDIEGAMVLSGQTVRIGYPGPDSRKAAMVEAIRQSCEPAGITVVDASKEGQSAANLSLTTESQYGYEIYTEGTLDAVLQPVDPLADFGKVSPLPANVEGIRGSERISWNVVRTIPLAQEPRTFVYNRTVKNVVPNTDLSGIGWNMDKWSVSNNDDEE